MTHTDIYSQFDDTAAELIALDVLVGNLTAYRADFNDFSEMVLNDGRVIRQIEQPGGSKTYSVVENLGLDFADQEAYMNKAGDWTEQSTDSELENLINWVAAVEA